MSIVRVYTSVAAGNNQGVLWASMSVDGSVAHSGGGFAEAGPLTEQNTVGSCGITPAYIDPDTVATSEDALLLPVLGTSMEYVASQDKTYFSMAFQSLPGVRAKVHLWMVTL